MTLYIVSNALRLHCRRNDPCTRLELAQRFRAMYRSLGMDLPSCAKFLHVTERTLHNWESGKHDIPYATFKLLRLMNGLELPGKTWAGWQFQGGKLWSPEGRSFEGTDGSWWSLLLRQARQFPVLSARLAQLESKLQKAQAAEGAPPRGGVSAAAAVAANQPCFELGGSAINFGGYVRTHTSFGIPQYETPSRSPMVITGTTYD
jgi:DNA-binding XRE family transcriptional regulator